MAAKPLYSFRILKEEHNQITGNRRTWIDPEEMRIQLIRGKNIVLKIKR
jgi:hypothetical protein